MNAEVIPKKPIYAGLFMVVLATLMFEILLTRIFSVSMWYHFAFMAISVTMFGMTIGAILVYLFPNYFTQERAKYHLALGSLLFAIFVVVSFLTLEGPDSSSKKEFNQFLNIAKRSNFEQSFKW